MFLERFLMFLKVFYRKFLQDQEENNEKTDRYGVPVSLKRCKICNNIEV